MGFALRHGDRDYPLGETRFIIGRSESCQLCLDDPMASRNHAVLSVRDNGVILEDLKSRNGVFVNDERIKTSLLLSDGDVIRVGAAEMVVVRRGKRNRAETLVQKPHATVNQAFGVLGTLADKALALGHGEEAERILGRQLDQSLERLESQGPLPDAEFERCRDYSFSIGTHTRKGKWLDYLFRLHSGQERLMDAEMVNTLYSIAKKMPGSNPAHLRIYLDGMRAQAPNLGPGERFVLKRLEGLEALLS
jgi:pSer/pThr/pTyr-binding forkhead associated (FHA) protein